MRCKVCGKESSTHQCVLPTVEIKKIKLWVDGRVKNYGRNPTINALQEIIKKWEKL